MKFKNEKQRQSLRVLNGLNVVQNTGGMQHRLSNPTLESPAHASSAAQRISIRPLENQRGSVDTQVQMYELNSDNEFTAPQNNHLKLPLQQRIPDRNFNLDLSGTNRNQLNGPLRIQPSPKHPMITNMLSDRGNQSSFGLMSPKDLRTGPAQKQIQNTPKVGLSGQPHVNVFAKNRRSMVTAAEYNSIAYLPAQSEDALSSQNAVNNNNNNNNNLLLMNSNKDNPIYDTMDNTSNYDQPQGKFIHILDEDNKDGQYDTRGSNSKMRESVFDQKKRVKGESPASKSRSFIEAMRELCKTQAQLLAMCLGGFKRLSEKVEVKSTKFLKKQGRSEILWLLAALFVSVIVFSLLSLHTSRVSDSNSFDSLKAYLASSLIGAAFLFIVYGIIFIAINNYYVYLVLFFLQAVPSLFVFAIDIYVRLNTHSMVSKSVEHIAEPEYINAAYFFGLYFFWMATHFVLKDFKQTFNKSARNFFMLFWCAICGCLIIGYLVYTICTTYELNFFWGDITISVLGGPFLIVIAMSWVYMHFKFFEPHLQAVSVRRLANEERELEQLNDRSQIRSNANHIRSAFSPHHEDDQKQAFLANYPNRKEQQQQNRDDIFSDTEYVNGLVTVDPKTAAKEDRHFDSSSKKSNKIYPFDAGALAPAANEEFEEMDEEKQLKLLAEREKQAKLDEEEAKREKQSRDAERKRIQLKILLTKDTLDPRIKLLLENYCVIFGSAVLGGSLMVCCMISLLNLQHDLETGKPGDLFVNPRGAYLSIFYLFAVPTIILLGTAFTFSKASHRIKFIIFPVVGGLVPVLFFLPMSLVVDLFYQSRPIQLFFSLGPCMIGLYWVTLLYIKIKSIQISMFINAYICLFFAVPLLYILPQRKVEYFDGQDETAEVIQWTLIGIGIALLLTYLSIDVFIAVRRRYRRRALKKRLTDEGRKAEIEELEKNEFNENQRFDIADIFKYDLNDFGLWGNAFGYIFTLAVLAFMFFNKPVWVSPRQSGAILGMQFVIFFLFLISLIVLLMKIIPDEEQSAESYSEKITQISESKGERQQTLNVQHRVKRAILMFSFVYMPIILGIFAIIFKDNDEVRVNLITIIIGFPIIALIYLLFYKLKQNLYRQSRTAVPALVVFCWIFIYLPLGGILPSGAIYLSNGDEDNVDYERLLIGFLVIFLLIGFALIAIFLHMYFKRKDFEKKFLFIAAKVIRRLAKVHVKSDFHVVNLMYQGYLSKGEEGIREALVKLHNPVTYAIIPDRDPDPRYSKVIVDSTALENLKKKAGEKRNACLEKFLSLFMYFLCCCYKDSLGTKLDDLNKKLYDEEGNPLLGDTDENGNQIGDILNEELNNQQKQQDDEEIIIEEDPWMKKYLLNKKLRPFPEKIIEPLRRYDLGVQLEISKPWTDGFLKHIFHIFAQGSENKYDGVRWLDYLMFKELLLKGGVIPCKEIEDYQIDLIYDKFTQNNGLPNKKPAVMKVLERMLREIARLKYPFEMDNDEAYAKLERNWLYPYLLWNVPPLRALYIHEWDYVLFLLKLYGMDDLYKEMVEEDEGYFFKMKKEFGLIKDDMSDIDNLILPDVDGRMNGRKSKCARCCDRFKKFLKKLLDDSLYFVKSMCLLNKDIDSEEKNEMELEVKLINKTLLKHSNVGSKRNKDGKGYFHEESPEWPEIVDHVIDEIQFQEKEFARKKDEELGIIELRSSHTNRMYIFAKTIELVSIAFLAFRPAAKQWGIEGILLQILNILTTENPDSVFSIKFAIAFVFVFLFAFVLFSSVKRIRTIRYGYCESKKKRHYLCNSDFFQVQFSSIVGIGLYFWIFKILFDSFSCDYAVVPQYLHQEHSLICFESAHKSLFGLSVIGIMVFYPLACFTWGNVQYQNRSLDLKYDTTYLVIQSQIKLILAAGTAFLAHENIQIYYFGFSTFLLFFLAFINSKMKPCYVKKINPLETGALFVCGWWHLSGFIVEISSVPIIGVVVLLLGTIVIGTVCVLNWKILHAKDLEEAAIRNANKKEEVAPKEIVENDNDDDEGNDPSLENLNQTIYTNLENQLPKYDPALLKLTNAMDAEGKRIQEERRKKLEEYNRRVRIMEELDREDEEDGVKERKREPQEWDEDYVDIEDRPKIKPKKQKVSKPNRIRSNW